MPVTEPLTIPEILALSKVVQAVVDNAFVSRLMETGDVVDGIARRIGEKGTGNSLPSTDVRDQFMWVTTTGGFEAFWPVSELVAQVQRGEFAVRA